MTVLNTIVAETLKQFKKDVDASIDKGEKKEIAIMHVIQKYIIESKSILFEGDGYSEEWAKEAQKRGLANVKTTPLALDEYITDATKRLFKTNDIYTHAELEARHEIMLESYIKKVQIEARTMGELATSLILPSAVKYQNVLIENINGLKASGLKESSYSSQLRILEQISNHINGMSTGVQDMIEERKKANVISDTRQKAIAYCDNVKEKYFDEIRYHVDKLEMLVDDAHWLLPKYREMLFLR
jgi:glutamine synthetase